MNLLGADVRDYLRWKKNEWGAADATITEYSHVLYKFALYHAGATIDAFETPHGTDKLRGCWDHHWGTCAPGTRAKIRSIWVDFFDWAIREGRGIHGNPARALTAPKKRGVKREPYSTEHVRAMLDRVVYLPDRLAVTLVLEYGLRRAELGAVRFRDFDHDARQLTIVGKGTKVRVLPIVDDTFWEDLGVLAMDPDWFLVGHRQGKGERHATLDYYYYPDRTYDHSKGYSAAGMHKWWYARIEEAGLLQGERKGLGMHRGRHTVATEILRSTGNLVAAQVLLGHADIGTTRDSYAQFDTTDLARVLTEVRGNGQARRLVSEQGEAACVTSSPSSSSPGPSTRSAAPSTTNSPTPTNSKPPTGQPR